MKIYLAGVYSRPYLIEKFNPEMILESFFYAKDAPIFMENIVKNNTDFLLDSGAFTFMNQKGKVDFDSWVVAYAEFINKFNVDNFLELDIDSVVGIKEVERLRGKLESLTQKKCIPVWHVSRGHKYWLDMIKKYKYVAIGGIVTKEIKKQQYPIFLKLLQDANLHGCKVHGLGFTHTSLLKKYPFYSVDSTSWLSGSRFAHVYRFQNARILQQSRPNGKKMVNYKIVDDNNFCEWLKFQRYAKNAL
ncbi:hypothetical protein EOM81_10250 [bacterium]|nr:hypothetical protein [bacterium]